MDPTQSSLPWQRRLSNGFGSESVLATPPPPSALVREMAGAGFNPLPSLIGISTVQPVKLAPANPLRQELHIRLPDGTAGQKIYLMVGPVDSPNFFPVYQGETYVLPVAGEVWARAASGPTGYSATIYLAEVLSAIPQ